MSFYDMMHLFACGATGRMPEANRDYNIEEITKLALQQGVWPVVFCGIKSLRSIKPEIMSDEMYALHNQQFMGVVTKSIRKNMAVGNTVKMLEKNNIRCCMLKGQVISQLYKTPETRISGDTDILLDTPELENAVCDIMAQNGFEVKERPRTSHHAMCTSAATGLFEFHLSLYDELFEDVWFDNKVKNQEPYRKFTTTEGFEYETLGYTDGAIFITLHFVKHFLSQGASVRMLMDMLLYNNAYKEHIDFERYNSIMGYLKYDKFIKCCYEIGRVYFSFDYEKQDVSDELIKTVIADFAKTGLFGSVNSINMYEVYTEHRYARFKNDNYNEYMKEWSGMSLWFRLFPDLKTMTRMYPILAQHKYLLPVMWIKRIATYPFNNKKHIEKNYNNERLKLVKELDMI